MNRQRLCTNKQMLTRPDRSVRRVFLLIPVLLAVFPALTATSATSQEQAGYWHEVRSIDASDLGMTQIEGLAYDSAADRFLIFGSRPSDADGLMSITWMNSVEDVLDSFPSSLPASIALNAAIDPLAGEMLLLNSAAPVEGGLPARSLPSKSLGLRDPQGVTVDAANFRLFILDANELVIAPLETMAEDTADGGALSNGVRRLAIDAAAAGDLRGIAYNPANDHLYVAAPDRNRIYELTTDAQLIAELDLAELGPADLRNLVIAPSGDPTDEPGVMSLYAADRGPTGAGRIVELYLVESPAAVFTVTALDPTSFRITQTSDWSPPSPDPSGIDYHPQLKRLLVVDGEVEEMPIFQGKNLFQAKITGASAKSCNLTGFSTEPVGVAVNPANGFVYISDDNADRVFQISLGPDKKLCTGDDVRTSINTRSFDNFDPEGVAFGQNMIFVADGVGAEVMAIAPGANGVFDDLPPVGDDVVDHQFDTATLGIHDPEGIGYHPQRDTLFLVSRLERDFLFEVSTAGVLLNTFDISPLDTILPAGVGVGPASQGGSGMSIYIVDRGIDNGQDPNENDGRLYEVTLDAAPPPAGNPIYLSHAANTSTAFPGLPQTSDEDILFFDGNSWSIYFDGSDVGLSGADLSAFDRVNADTLLMSFMQPVTIAGPGKVDDSDIVRFDATSLGNNTAGAFSLYFDGSDVGLTNPSEDIDTLDLLPDGRLIVSTAGAYAVSGAQGKGDDLLSFSPATLGATTSGMWALYFDGSDVGIKPATNVDGVSVAANGVIFLSTAKDFSPAGQAIGDEDVLGCTPVTLGATTVCNFASNPYFDGSAWGLAADDIDAIHIP